MQNLDTALFKKEALIEVWKVQLDPKASNKESGKEVWGRQVNTVCTSTTQRDLHPYGRDNKILLLDHHGKASLKLEGDLGAFEDVFSNAAKQILNRLTIIIISAMYEE